MWWGRYVKGKSINKMVAFGSVAYGIRTLHSILNEKAKEINFPVGLDYFNLLIHGFNTYLSLKNYELAYLTQNFILFWGVFNGILLLVNPRAFGNVYGIPERNEHVYTERRSFGEALIGLGITIAAVMQDLDGIKALGYSYLWHFAALFIRTIINKEFDPLQIPQTPIYTWMLVAAICSGYFLL